jgi:hypothetical protein
MGNRHERVPAIRRGEIGADPMSRLRLSFARRWLRETGAVLIFVFVIGVSYSNKAAIASGDLGRVIDAAETHKAMVLVEIDVTDIAHDVKLNATLLDVVDIARRKQFRRFDREDYRPTCNNRPIVRAMQGDGFMIVERRQHREPDAVTVNPISTFDYSRFSASPIYNNQSARDLFRISGQRYLNGNMPDMELRPLFGNEDLVAKIDGSLQLNALPTEDKQLQDADNSEDAGQFDKRPIGLVFNFALAAVNLGFGGSLWGWNNFYNGRRLFGTALISCGGLLGGFGFFAWWGYAF